MQDEVKVSQVDEAEIAALLMNYGIKPVPAALVTELARHRAQAERETLARMEAEIKRLREALDEIRDLPGEINPCNYDHDDACELNRQFCYAITVADTALNPPAPEAGQ